VNITALLTLDQCGMWRRLWRGLAVLWSVFADGSPTPAAILCR